MTTNNTQSIIETLEQMKSVAPTSGGICDAINEGGTVFGVIFLASTWHDWSNWSGCNVFPVPHPEYVGDQTKKGIDAAGEAYLNLEYRSPLRWSLDSPYGALRIELVQYLIDGLTSGTLEFTSCDNDNPYSPHSIRKAGH